MAAETEIERLLVRIVGDAASFEKMVRNAKKQTVILATVVDESAERMAKVQETLDEVGKSIQSVGEEMQSVGKKMTLFITTPILALGAAAVKVGSDFETGFTGVRKTVDATESELATLRQGFKDLSLEIPVAATELLSIGEAAGQLGIKTENILSFTETIAQLGVATNLTTEEAASDFAKFANVVGLPQENISNLGSSIVALGNSVGITNGALATTERDIVALSMRLAGAGATIGLTVPQITALAASLSAVGLEAEAGGTAFSKLFIDLQSAVATGGEDLTAFAAVAGKTAEEFATQFRENAAGAIRDLLAGLNQLEPESRVLALKSIGVEAGRMTNALLSSSRAVGLIDDAMKTSEKAFEENTALAEEAARAFNTFGSFVIKVKNAFKFLLEDAFVLMRPTLVDILARVKALVKWFIDLSSETKLVGIAILAIAAVAGPATIALGGLVSMTGLAVVSFGKFLIWINTVNIAMIKLAITSATAWAAATLGLSLLVTGVVAAGIALVKFQKETGVFDPLVDAIREIGSKLKDIVLPILKELRKEFVEKILPAITKTADEIAKKLEPAMKDLADVAVNLFDALSPLVPLIGDRLVKAIEASAFVIEHVLIPQLELMLVKLNLAVGLLIQLGKLLPGEGLGETPSPPEDLLGSVSSARERRAGVLSAEKTGQIPGAVDSDAVKAVTKAAEEAKKATEAVRQSAEENLDDTAKMWDKFAQNLQEILDDINEEIKTVTKSLEEQVETFDFSADEMELHRLKLMGANQEQLNAIKVLQDTLRVKKQDQEATERAKQITEQYQTALQKFSKVQRDLNQLLSMGAIDQGTFNRALDDAKKQLKDSEKDLQVNATVNVRVNTGGVEAILRGSVEEAILLAQLNARGEKEAVSKPIGREAVAARREAREVARRRRRPSKADRESIAETKAAFERGAGLGIPPIPEPPLPTGVPGLDKGPITLPPTADIAPLGGVPQLPEAPTTFPAPKDLGVDLPTTDKAIPRALSEGNVLVPPDQLNDFSSLNLKPLRNLPREVIPETIPPQPPPAFSDIVPPGMVFPSPEAEKIFPEEGLPTEGDETLKDILAKIGDLVLVSEEIRDKDPFEDANKASLG